MPTTHIAVPAAPADTGASRRGRPRIRRVLAGLAGLAIAATVAVPLTAGPAAAASGVRVTFTNTGCRSASLTWSGPAGPVSYGTIPAGASKTLTSYPTHRWLMDVGTMRVGSYTVGTAAAATKPFDSYGCTPFTTQFVAVHSGKCLNVPGFSKADGTRIIQYTCGTGATNERFVTVTAPGGYLLRSVSSGKCLTVPGASTVPGTGVVQQTCGYLSRQTLVPQVNGSLTFRHSGQCLDVSGASVANHAAIVQWPCAGQTNQRWSMR